MNKVEFDRRVALAIKTTQSLLGGSGDPGAAGVKTTQSLLGGSVNPGAPEDALTTLLNHSASCSVHVGKQCTCVRRNYESAPLDLIANISVVNSPWPKAPPHNEGVTPPATSLAAEGMTQSEALSFYEHVIDALDAQLEEMMAAWQEPEGLAEEAKTKSSKPNPGGMG